MGPLKQHPGAALGRGPSGGLQGGQVCEFREESVEFRPVGGNPGGSLAPPQPGAAGPLACQAVEAIGIQQQ